MSNIPTELVRGNVKAVMKSLNNSSADLWNVKPTDIKFLEGFNLRTHNEEYEAHIKWITESILANGYYQDKPIAGFVADDPVAGNVIFCTDGHSRVTAVLRAIKLGAPIESIPMVIKPKGTTMEDLTVALVTSNEGKPFSPFEKGLAIKRLIEMGMTEAVIAKKLSLTVPYVGDLLNLVGAPVAVREMVTSGQISATAAVTTLKKHGAKAGEKLQTALETAKAAGKTKVTAKHLKKRAALKLKGEIKKAMEAGASTITISLDVPLDVAVAIGDRVRITISEEEL
jgi:hypothetical protein